MIAELLFSLALAQDTTTTCQPNAAGQVVCRSVNRDGREPNMRCAGGDWLLAGCTIGAHREAREAREAQQRAASAHQQTMDFLRAGDCSAAINAALGTGDLQFATEVRSFCAAGK